MRLIDFYGVAELSKALIGYECGTSRDEERTKNVLENISKLIQKVQGYVCGAAVRKNESASNQCNNCYRVRALGSAALNMAMVALGGADAYFEFGIHAWDVAAGDLLVREAGGVVIDPAGTLIGLCSHSI